MGRPHLLNVVRVVVGLLVLAAVVVALARNWGEVSEHLARLDARTLVLSCLLAVLAPVLTLQGWRVLLHDLGARMALPAAASVFFVGQLGKYLPGSVWSVAIQADMGGRLGVARRALGVAGLLNLALAVVTGTIVGVPALPLLLRRAPQGAISWWWVALTAVLVLILLWPRMLNALITRGLRLVRRHPLDAALGGRALAATVVLFIGAWASAGASLWVLVRALAPGADAVGLALATVAGFGLAGAIGMLSVIVPAGVGVRDGVLVLLLVGLVPTGAAAAAVLVQRFLTILIDLVVAALGWLWARSHRLLPDRDPAA